MLKNKVLLSSLSVLILIFLIPFSFLKYGVSTKEVNLESVNIQSLYLKIDKKFVIKIDTINILPTKDEEDTTISPYWIKKGLEIFSFLIQEIEVKNIYFSDEIFSLSYKDSQLQIDSKLAKVSANYNSLESEVTTNINIDIPNSDLKIEAKSTLKDKELVYKVNTNQFDKLTFLNNYMQLDENLSEWLFDRLQADKFQVQDLSGKIDITKLDKFSLSDLHSEVLMENLSLNYDDSKPKLSLQSVSIEKEDDTIYIDIKEQKDLNKTLSISGKVITDMEFKKLSFKGKIYFEDLIVTCIVGLEDQLLSFELSSNRFKDPNIFKKLVPIPDAIQKWGFDRLSAKGYKIEKVEGKVLLPHGKVDFNSLKVVATLDDIIMDFNPKKAFPLLADKVQVVFEKGSMDFNLTSPFSNDVNLKGSSATIYDLFGNSGLFLNLQSISPINETLVRVVESYGVSIPRDLGLSQIGGASDIVTKIDIPFGDDPLDIFVTIKNENSIFSIKENNISFERFDFTYKDKDIHIKDTKAIIEENYFVDMNVSFYTRSNQAIVNSVITDKNETMKLNISNSTNLNSNLSSGNIDVNYLNIPSVISIEDENIPYSLNLGQTNKLYLPTFMTQYSFDTITHKLDVDSFSKFYELFDQNNSYPKIFGNLHLETKDFNDINITTHLAGLDYPIFHKDEKINKLDLNIDIKDRALIHLKNKDHLDIQINLENKLSVTGKVKDIGVQLFSSRDDKMVVEDNSSEPFVLEDFELPYIDLNIQNGYISYDTKTVNYQNIDFFANQKIIDLDAEIGESKIKFDRMGKDIVLKLESLDNAIANKLIGKELLKGSDLNISVYGDQYKQTGEIDINQIKLFDQDENETLYTIFDGSVFYQHDINNSKLDIKNIKINGDLASVRGDIKLNYKDDQIDGNVTAYVIEGYSDFIGSIPIINYIFLGSDKKVDYSAKIDGKLSKPEIETFITRETLSVPIYIIGRILYLPIKGVEYLSNDED